MPSNWNVPSVPVVVDFEPTETVTPIIGCPLIVPMIFPARFPGPGSGGRPVISLGSVGLPPPPSSLHPMTVKSIIMSTTPNIHKELLLYFMIYSSLDKIFVIFMLLALFRIMSYKKDRK
jgi:hypothetical protein